MILWTIVGTLITSLSALMVYIYYHKRGQFEDSEEVKYQLFHDED